MRAVRQLALLTFCAALLTGEVGALSAAAADSPTVPYRMPRDVLAGDARGPYRTGTYEELMIDQGRDETTTTDPSDKRHLMVQIWYPAAIAGDPERAPYVLHPELYRSPDNSGWLDEVAGVRTMSVLNAPVAAPPLRFPVLIYNPGGWHPGFTGTFQTEFLASHGYVVVAIGHTGLNLIQRFPDGYEYHADINLNLLEDEPQTQGLTPVELYDLNFKRSTEKLMPLHVQDVRFVIDRLQAMNSARGGRFYQRLNLDQIGALGWSLGGAVSLQASRDEPRIKAAADLDGWLYADVVGTGVPRPVLLMHGDSAQASPTAEAAERDLVLTANAQFWRMLSKTRSDWYDVTLERAPHHLFSDDSLAAPPNPKDLHPHLAHDIVNRFTLEFFDRHLRGSTDTPLLSGTERYPEADVIRNIGH